MTPRELKSKLASEMAIYGAGVRRQRMLEEEQAPEENEFQLDDIEAEDDE